ncbi:unnamed protein product [Ceratitis capitata]|uniref:(Mediterranean fruit fly) hypothetical protein n=1 Tax=Ceratitis capitata TaxID=7213 RepID=A0A811ULZ3_CERCA|nr:unnamed protein product [Ceratitis capitata]
MWLLDSGASSHMCMDKKFFNELEPKRQEIVLASGETIHAQGIGSINEVNVGNGDAGVVEEQLENGDDDEDVYSLDEDSDPVVARKRGRGRPKLIRDGGIGRPKKQYKEAEVLNFVGENPQTDSGTGTPVTMRVDPKGFYLYWIDQNNEMDILDIATIRDTRTGAFAKKPKVSIKAMVNSNEPSFKAANVGTYVASEKDVLPMQLTFY